MEQVLFLLRLTYGGGENVLPAPFDSTGSEYDANLKTAIKGHFL